MRNILNANLWPLRLYVVDLLDYADDATKVNIQ